MKQERAERAKCEQEKGLITAARNEELEASKRKQRCVLSVRESMCEGRRKGVCVRVCVCEREIECVCERV